MKSKSKAGDPNMEDILASIRKIVADEPAAAAPGPLAAKLSSAAALDPQRTRASLDSDLANLLNATDSAPATISAAPETGSDPAPAPAKKSSSGWFFNRSAQPAPDAGDARRTPVLSNTLEQARTNVARATAAASANPLAPARGKLEMGNGSGQPATKPARDLGAVVPGRLQDLSGHPTSATQAALSSAAALAATAASLRDRALGAAEAGFSAAGAKSGAKARPHEGGTPSPAHNQPASAAAHQSLMAAVGNLPWARNGSSLTHTDGHAGSPGASGMNGASAPGSVRTLEDTVSDLLRPMLRDWLEANMPRIMEKAMRAELAAKADASGTKSGA
jgi:uncharacterized protein